MQSGAEPPAESPRIEGPDGLRSPIRGPSQVSIINSMAKELKKFTAEDLSRFTGENGSPIYVAYDGRVFDVTASRFWRGGTHMKRHPAGRDLTAEMSAAPHDMSVLDRYPQVGVLVPAGALDRASARPGVPGGEEAAGKLTLRSRVEQSLERHPFFRRHPHPMTVHFPIVFFIFTPLFTLLYLATGIPGFEITALNCLAAGLILCLVVIPTGFFTWWINYDARPMRAVTIKIVLSLCMFVDGLAVFSWRLADPGIMTRQSVSSILFLILDFLLLPMVVVVAWFGATLTFPLARTHRRGVSRS
jgi:predicted heme/steroid binding protein/uncharacterized membrane protein